MKTFNEFNESIRKTWGDPDWRRATKIYDHGAKKLAKFDDDLAHEPGFKSYSRGIRGKIARAVIKATAPFGRKIQTWQAKRDREINTIDSDWIGHHYSKNAKLTEPKTKLGKIANKMTSVNRPEVVDNLMYHHDNVHHIQQVLKRKRMRAKTNESLKDTWFNKDWRKANKIYTHHNKRHATDDPDLIFQADRTGIKGVIARTAIRATAPLSNRVRGVELGLRRADNHRYMKRVDFDTYSDNQSVVHKAKQTLVNNRVVGNLMYHHDNLRALKKKVQRQRMRAKTNESFWPFKKQQFLV